VIEGQHGWLLEFSEPFATLRRFVFLTIQQEREMINLGDIKEHMEVVGSDGGHVGKVDKLLGGEIELAKFDMGAGFKHHLIPVTWVELVDDDKVRLSLTKEEAKTQWREKH
jgi:hypothetical protein